MPFLRHNNPHELPSCGATASAAAHRASWVNADEKTVWARLPVGDSTTDARAVRTALRDAVRAVLADGGTSATNITGLTQQGPDLNDHGHLITLGQLLQP